LEGTEKHLVECKKREKIEKVTGSRDDKGEGGAFDVNLVAGEENRRSLRMRRNNQNLIWTSVESTEQYAGQGMLLCTAAACRLVHNRSIFL
jgi:hypothetical protein